MKFCSKCGTQVEDDIKFCPTCGSGFEEKPVNEVVETVYFETKEDSWQRKVSKIILIICKIAVIVGIVGLGIALIGALISSALATSFDESGLSAILSGAVAFEIIIFLPLFILGLVFIGKTLKCINEKKKISTGLKICVLLFVSIVPGIFLLTDSEDGYKD